MTLTMTPNNRTVIEQGRWKVEVYQVSFGYNLEYVKTQVFLISTVEGITASHPYQWGLSESAAVEWAQGILERAQAYTDTFNYIWGIK